MSTLPVIVTQADLDSEVAHLRSIGYPYVGAPEHHRHVLLSDGRIMSQWTNDDETGWEPESECSIYTLEEWADSVFCWANDC